MTEQLTKEMLVEFTTEARRMLALFNDVKWSGTPEMTDDEHIENFTQTLVNNRLLFPNLPEKTVMSWVSEGDSALALAITGNTPTSADRAKAITGFILNMPLLLEALEAWVELQDTHSTRVSELIEHNTAQLLENRAQRTTIRQQQAKIEWLLSQIPGVEAA